MTKKENTEQGVTDREKLEKGAYSDPSKIDKRRSLYEHTTPHHIVEDEVLEFMRLKGNERVLDVGCGSGSFLRQIARLFPETSLVGMDISSGMFTASREELQHEAANLIFIAGDVQNLPYGNESFDRVVAQHMLYHVPNIDQAVQEIARVLTHDGLTIITANSTESRPMYRTLKSIAARAMNRPEYPDSRSRFNLENASAFLKKHFASVVVVPYVSTLVLKSIQPYLDYFDSTRDFWDPKPDDAEWGMVLKQTKVFLQSIIDKQGQLIELNKFGVVVASQE